VDARGADRFAGQNETVDPVAGHVPGAVNMPFTAATCRPGRASCRRPNWRERWQSESQARAGTIVAMCGSGVTACHNLLALEAGRLS
jgi:thiosulfate/3-mercaptopyruvate sulfurtransferase